MLLFSLFFISLTLITLCPSLISQHAHHLSLCPVLRQFLTYLDSASIVQDSYNSSDLALAAVRRGDAWGVLYLTPTFTESTFLRYIPGFNVTEPVLQASTVFLNLDMTNQQIFVFMQDQISTAYDVFLHAELEFLVALGIKLNPREVCVQCKKSRCSLMAFFFLCKQCTLPLFDSLHFSIVLSRFAALSSLSAPPAIPKPSSLAGRLARQFRRTHLWRAAPALHRLYRAGHDHQHCLCAGDRPHRARLCD